VILNGSASGALSVGGSAQLRVTGGDIVVDSTASVAATTSGSGTVIVENGGKIRVAGGVSGTGFVPAPTTGSAAVPDPLADEPKPDTSALTAQTCCGSTLAPGIYTGGIQIPSQTTVTLQPGVYVLKGGGLSLGAGSTLTGSGVLLFNTTSTYPDFGGTCGSFSLTGGASYALSAPTSGVYRGLVIFQDPVCRSQVSMGGGNSVVLTGTLYAPTAALNLIGNSNITTTQIVVDTLSASGSSTAFAFQFDATAVASAVAPAHLTIQIPTLNASVTRGTQLSTVSSVTSGAGYGVLPPVSANLGGVIMSIARTQILNDTLTVTLNMTEAIPTGPQSLTICATDSGGREACDTTQVVVQSPATPTPTASPSTTPSPTPSPSPSPSPTPTPVPTPTPSPTPAPTRQPIQISNTSPVIGESVRVLNPYAGDWYSVFWLNVDGPKADPCLHVSGNDLLVDNDLTHYGTCFVNDRGQYEVVELTDDMTANYNDSIQSALFFDKQSVNVKNQFLFAYSLTTNGNVSVKAGNGTTRTITATLTSGSTINPVYFQIIGLPDGSTAVASPDSCAPTCTSTLTITTSASTAAGAYTITIIGDARGADIKTATFVLTITP
jgi:hypothetical protein